MMSRWLDRLRLRTRSLFQGSAVDAALRDELQLHLDEQTAEYIANGMTPLEARQAALRDFGPVARIEEECRDRRRVNVLSNLAQDLRYTFRSLGRQPLLVVNSRWRASSRLSDWTVVPMTRQRASREPGLGKQ